MAAAYYRIRKHRRRLKRYFTSQLVAENGEPLPDLYASKQACKGGIEATRRLAADAEVRDETGDTDYYGDPRRG